MQMCPVIVNEGSIPCIQSSGALCSALGYLNLLQGSSRFGMELLDTCAFLEWQL